jgi:hypothetical protein
LDQFNVEAVLFKKSRVASNENIQKRNAEGRVSHAHFPGILGRSGSYEIEA